MNALDNIDQVNSWIQVIVLEREKLIHELKKLAFVQKVLPSDANFILIKVENAKTIYNYLTENGIIVRDRSKVDLCEGCLRITVGTIVENIQLINTLKNYKT